MQTTSATWKQLWASGNAHVKTRVTIADVGTFTEGDVISAKISGVLYPDDDLGIGGVTSRKLELKLMLGDNPEPARGAEVTVEVALTDGTTTSEWLPKGTFCIDTRETDQLSQITTYVCYDLMILADKMAPDISAGYTMQSLAISIAQTLGLSIDSRSTFRTSTYTPALSGYTYREILSFIAIACCGNWTVTETDRLRLVAVGNAEGQVSLGKADYIQIAKAQLSRYDKGIKYQSVGQVVVRRDEDHTYSDGTAGDYNVEYFCPFAGLAEARAIRNAFVNAVLYTSYTPCFIRGRLNPAIEVGDYLGFEEEIDPARPMLVHPVATQNIYFGSLCLIEVENPTGKDVSHEYAKNVSGGGTNNLMSANRQIQMLNQQIEALTLRMSTAETQIQTISGGNNTSTE